MMSWCPWQVVYLSDASYFGLFCHASTHVENYRWLSAKCCLILLIAREIRFSLVGWHLRLLKLVLFINRVISLRSTQVFNDNGKTVQERSAGIGCHHTYRREIGFSRAEKELCPCIKSKIDVMRFAWLGRRHSRQDSYCMDSSAFSDRLKPIPIPIIGRNAFGHWPCCEILNNLLFT